MRLARISKPMPVPGGKAIPPTNKPFKIDVVTHRQIGLAK